MNNHIPSALENLDSETQAWIIEKINEVKSIYYDGIRDMVAHFDSQGFKDDELIAAWELLKNESKIRTAYKDYKTPKVNFLDTI